MRNVDKIRGLENQRDALRMQVAKFRKEREDLRAGVKDIEAASAAVTIAIALAYGGELDGAAVLRIPRVNVKELNDKYEIHAEVDGDERIIRVTQRKQEAATDDKAE